MSERSRANFDREVLSRRGLLAAASAAAAGGFVLAQSATGRVAIVRTDFASLPPYGNGTVPAGIRSRAVANVNGLTVHILEAGFESPGRPAVLLLHGFPELAYSWRKVMLPLAAAGYRVIAPDQRGYGRTAGWDDSYDADPDPFRMLNMVRDAVGLLYRATPVARRGPDAGAPVACSSALVRPEFPSVTIMSSPFEGTQRYRVNTANARRCRACSTDDGSTPNSPRSSATEILSTNSANRRENEDMLLPRRAARVFRAYYH